MLAIDHLPPRIEATARQHPADEDLVLVGHADEVDAEQDVVVVVEERAEVSALDLFLLPQQAVAVLDEPRGVLGRRAAGDQDLDEELGRGLVRIGVGLPVRPVRHVRARPRLVEVQRHVHHDQQLGGDELGVEVRVDLDDLVGRPRIPDHRERLVAHVHHPARDLFAAPGREVPREDHVLAEDVRRLEVGEDVGVQSPP